MSPSRLSRREEKGLRVGTWHEGSKVTHRKIIYLFIAGRGSLLLSNFPIIDLDIGKNSVIDFNNYMREVCAADLLAHSMSIGGPNTTVEIDESQFSRRKNNRGRVCLHAGFSVEPRSLR